MALSLGTAHLGLYTLRRAISQAIRDGFLQSYMHGWLLVTRSQTFSLHLKYPLTLIDARGDMIREVCHVPFHEALSNILKPIYEVMENGILIKCGDGIQRRCYPGLAQCVADYKEQRLLAGILFGSCPKYLIPPFRKSAETASQLDPNSFEPRDGDHA